MTSKQRALRVGQIIRAIASTGVWIKRMVIYRNEVQAIVQYNGGTETLVYRI